MHPLRPICRNMRPSDGGGCAALCSGGSTRDRDAKGHLDGKSVTLRATRAQYQWTDGTAVRELGPAPRRAPESDTPRRHPGAAGAASPCASDAIRAGLRISARGAVVLDGVRVERRRCGSVGAAGWTWWGGRGRRGPVWRVSRAGVGAWWVWRGAPSGGTRAAAPGGCPGPLPGGRSGGGHAGNVGVWGGGVAALVPARCAEPVILAACGDVAGMARRSTGLAS